MKKKIICILAAVLAAAVLIAGCIVYPKLPQPLSYDISSVQNIGSDIEIIAEGDDFVSVKKKSDGKFKVLMFTDLHLDGNNDTSSLTVSNLVGNIVKEKPDLVILGGDNVTSALNKKRTKQLAQIFENLGVYWAGVLGNHEGDSPLSISREKMVDIFSSYEHCLMKKGKEEVDGNGNYVLNILNSDRTIKESFFFFDTMDEMNKEQKEKYALPENEDFYDGLKASQVEWYKYTVTRMKAESGFFSSVAVLHIPLPQFESAVSDGGKFLYGDKREGICSSGFESGFFDTIKECDSTKAVFCSHDHLNNFGVMYDGILLSYIEPSGYGSYTAKSKLGYEEKDWLQGYTVLTLNDDGTFLQEQHRNSENTDK